jgi:hypothetical protein
LSDWTRKFNFNQLEEITSMGSLLLSKWFLILAMKTSVLIIQVPDMESCMLRSVVVLREESPRAVYCMPSGPEI